MDVGLRALCRHAGRSKAVIRQRGALASSVCASWAIADGADTIRAQLTANTLSIDHSAFRVAEAPSAPRFATLPAATRDKERCRHHSNKCTAAT